jgi:hypothetical protein
MRSTPASVTAAARKDLNPSIGRTNRLIALFDNVVEVFDLMDFGACLGFGIVAFDRRHVGAALVDRDRLRVAWLITFPKRRDRPYGGGVPAIGALRADA